MKRIVCVFLVVIIMFNLSGCLARFRSNSRAELLNNEYESETQAISRVETEVVKALNAKDKELLKSVFSQKAISAAEDLDAGIDYVLSIYKGDFVEISGRNHSSEEHIDAAARINLISAWCYIQTTEATYRLSYIVYPVYDPDASAIGVYRLNLKCVDDEKSDDYDRFRLAGIDYPDREIIHTTTNAILDCMGDRRTDALREMFSAQALSEEDDFKSGAQYAFDLYNGASVIGNYDSWLHFEDEDGKVQLEAFIAIKTKYDDFVLYFSMCQSGEDSGKLYRLKLTEVDEPRAPEKYSLGNEYEQYGVYNPTWDE